MLPTPQERGHSTSWADILTHWRLVEQDLADSGVDVGDDQLMATRSWRWLTVRIQGLLTHPTRATRLSVALAPPEPRGGP